MFEVAIVIRESTCVELEAESVVRVVDTDCAHERNCVRGVPE